MPATCRQAPPRFWLENSSTVFRNLHEKPINIIRKVGKTQHRTPRVFLHQFLVQQALWLRLPPSAAVATVGRGGGVGCEQLVERGLQQEGGK